MKFYHSFLAIVATTALLLSSCNKGEPESTQPGNEQEPEQEQPKPDVEGEPESMEFTLTPEALTKAAIDGHNLSWTSGDAVSLFDGKSNCKFDFTSSDKFTGTAVASGVYYALYPYNEDASLTNSGISMNIPSNQEGGAGDVISVGYSTSTTIGMKNVTGILSFVLDEENVTQVTIEGSNGEILTGEAVIEWNNGNPKVTAGTNSSTSVTIGDGSTVLEKGKTYYASVIPTSLTGYTVTFTYKEDTSTYEGYIDQWTPGMTNEGLSKQTITRGVSKMSIEKTDVNINLTRGRLYPLGPQTATLVYYDDAIPATIDGKTLENATWDADAQSNPTWDVASTDNPYSGTNCIKWTMTSQWGEIIFQTNNSTGESRGALDLTEYRNAHFALEFAFKAEANTKCYVRFMQWLVNSECLRNMYDISSYATGDWVLVQIPLDEMYLSNYVWNLGTNDRHYLTKEDLIDNTFYQTYPFAWDYVYRLNFAPNIDVDDTSNLNKTVYIDEIRIKKVIFSDQTAE